MAEEFPQLKIERQLIDSAAIVAELTKILKVRLAFASNGVQYGLSWTFAQEKGSGELKQQGRGRQQSHTSLTAGFQYIELLRFDVCHA